MLIALWPQLGEFLEAWDDNRKEFGAVMNLFSNSIIIYDPRIPHFLIERLGPMIATRAAEEALGDPNGNVHRLREILQHCYRVIEHKDGTCDPLWMWKHD
jgi:hypothetical protein